MPKAPGAWNDASREESWGPSAYQTPANQPFRLRTATWSHGIESGESLHRSKHAYKAQSDAGSQPREPPHHQLTEPGVNSTETGAKDIGNIHTEEARTQSRTGTDQAEVTGGYDPRNAEIPRRMTVTLEEKLRAMWRVAEIESKLRQQYILEQAEEIAHKSYKLTGMKEDHESVAYTNVLLANVGQLIETYKQKLPTTRHIPVETHQPRPVHPPGLHSQWPATDEKAITYCNWKSLKKGKKRALIPHRDNTEDDDRLTFDVNYGLPAVNYSSPAIEMANAQLFEPKQDKETEETYQRRVAAQKRWQDWEPDHRHLNLQEEMETAEHPHQTRTKQAYVPQTHHQRSSSSSNYKPEQSEEETQPRQELSPQHHVGVRFHGVNDHGSRIKQEDDSSLRRGQSKGQVLARTRLAILPIDDSSKGKWRRDTPPHMGTRKEAAPQYKTEQSARKPREEIETDEEIEDQPLRRNNDRKRCLPMIQRQPLPRNHVHGSPPPTRKAMGGFTFCNYQDMEVEQRTDAANTAI
ncbi:hypothetical protein AGABI1DRAFT_126919 [Agaricus bisporus var. burnettii JB137-S8]|uniref:Uncharacterized protein n=1 Tax=Agaricus bisporus var. burnettii (strain JB137-S8 / ATCC MYA-4627 / FGSC 10392) TaxID=597362 RepID=K5WZA3_AGABU|nr:uncharacterized protein AGABI1DRAFT_126919 [Agaricus bisporus var. burnettii JB137-S8]EKM80871.1 hypothetical protein AGABI1DRAFT_126919 [Agaricus bisporus var. burnettii JB137-S8]